MHWAFFAPELSATSSIDLGWIMSRSPASRAHAGQDLTDAPPLVLRQRPRLLDQDAVPDLAGVRLVVSLQPLRPRDNPLVARMAVDALDPDHPRLRHLVAHHDAFLRFRLSHANDLLLARALQLALAENGLRARQIPLGLLHPRGVLGHTHGQLEPEVEQLFGQFLDLLLQVFAAHLPPGFRFHEVLSDSLECPGAGHELGLDADLLGGQAKAFARRRLVHALHLVHHAPGFDHGDPELRVALALAHPRLGRLLRHRLVRKDPDEDLAAALHAAGERDARRLDLAVGDPAGLERLEAEVAEGQRRAALRLASHAPALGLAVLDALGHQHGCLRLRRLTLGGQHLALEDPDLHTDRPVRRMRLGQAVVDVGADRVQRHAAVAIPLAARDLGAAQAPGAGDPDAVRAQPERGGYRLLHGAAKRDALLQLQRHVFGHQLRVELRVDHLFDVEVDLLGRARLDLV